jgi:hypothetical protein
MVSPGARAGAAAVGFSGCSAGPGRDSAAGAGGEGCEAGPACGSASGSSASRSVAGASSEAAEGTDAPGPAVGNSATSRPSCEYSHSSAPAEAVRRHTDTTTASRSARTLLFARDRPSGNRLDKTASASAGSVACCRLAIRAARLSRSRIRLTSQTPSVPGRRMGQPCPRRPRRGRCGGATSRDGNVAGPSSPGSRQPSLPCPP